MDAFLALDGGLESLPAQEFFNPGLEGERVL
jgi:hypothetical protein